MHSKRFLNVSAAAQTEPITVYCCSGEKIGEKAKAVTVSFQKPLPWLSHIYLCSLLLHVFAVLYRKTSQNNLLCSSFPSLLLHTHLLQLLPTDSQQRPLIKHNRTQQRLPPASQSSCLCLTILAQQPWTCLVPSFIVFLASLRTLVLVSSHSIGQSFSSFCDVLPTFQSWTPYNVPTLCLQWSLLLLWRYILTITTIQMYILTNNCTSLSNSFIKAPNSKCLWLNRIIHCPNQNIASAFSRLIYLSE